MIEKIGAAYTPLKEIRITQSEWTFLINKDSMMKSKEVDQFMDKVGTQSVPEILYGNNYLKIGNPTKDIMLTFTPQESLSLAGYAKRESEYIPIGAGETPAEYISRINERYNEKTEIREVLGRIDVIPDGIKALQADIWGKKDTSGIKDYKQMEVISDWTYSTPYKGYIYYLSQQSKEIQGVFGDMPEGAQGNNIYINILPQPISIPTEKLTPENPIIRYEDITLFEDDLDDLGYTKNNVRVRVMEDCFFVLLRYYLRLDNMCVRVFDTRVYHEFGTNHILREFQYRQSTWDQLKIEGFTFTSDIVLNPHQSDLVFPKMKTMGKVMEKIWIE